MSSKLTSFDVTRQRLAVLKQKRPDFPVAHARLVRLIANVHQRTVDAYNELVKQHGLTYRTYSALMTIYTSGSSSITPSELGEAMGEKRTNVTRLCDELIEMGLIVRETSGEDRRSFQLQVTAQGEAMIDRLMPEIAALLATLYGPLSDDEHVGTETALTKTLDVLVNLSKRIAKA
ncbi:MAG: MarR family transcriptional regulator [Burkholderiaceae bacterium]|nr:MarR family transcriptional regulator [Burkholderiaceae bacterium]